MKKEEFIKYIEKIGFKYNKRISGLDRYNYGELFVIDLYITVYDFQIGANWRYNISYTDLTHLEKYFKKELRSIKLKELLK